MSRTAPRTSTPKDADPLTRREAPSALHRWSTSCATRSAKSLVLACLRDSCGVSGGESYHANHDSV